MQNRDNNLTPLWLRHCVTGLGGAYALGALEGKREIITY